MVARARTHYHGLYPPHYDLYPNGPTHYPYCWRTPQPSSASAQQVRRLIHTNGVSTLFQLTSVPATTIQPDDPPLPPAISSLLHQYFHFFLKKHILQFPPKLTLQLDQNIVMAILQLIINTFQSSMNLLFPFNNTPKCIFISIYYLVFGSRILKFQGIWNA